MKKVLVIAYYFPPLGMGGVQRVMKFCKYLPQFGWQPVVLTVKNIHYYAKDPTLEQEIRGLKIFRTESLDPARINAKLPGKNNTPEFQLRTNFPPRSFQSLGVHLMREIFFPDSKILWLPFAVREGAQIIEKENIDLIFSTAPPISSHLIAHLLKKHYHLPWVADFRDYWSSSDYIPTHTPLHCWMYRKFTHSIIASANGIIAVSSPIIETINSENPDTTALFEVITNGFDWEDFSSIQPRKFTKFTIIYSGNLNPLRSPEPFFRALSLLFRENPQLPEKISVIFLGQHFDIDLSHLPDDIAESISFISYLPHRQSLEYLLGADLLLFLLAPQSAPGVVTGKIFEYLATQKPILAIMPEHVAAKDIVVKFPQVIVVPPHDVLQIKTQLCQLFEQWESGHFRSTGLKTVPQNLQLYERKSLTQKLADFFQTIIE